MTIIFRFNQQKEWKSFLFLVKRWEKNFCAFIIFIIIFYILLKFLMRQIASHKKWKREITRWVYARGITERWKLVITKGLSFELFYSFLLFDRKKNKNVIWNQIYICKFSIKNYKKWITSRAKIVQTILSLIHPFYLFNPLATLIN
jgi:hypothetical protein